MKNILDYPDLGDYLLVTKTIKKHEPITVEELCKKLENEAKKVHIKIIVDYLYTKKDIEIDKEGKITWIQK